MTSQTSFQLDFLPNPHTNFPLFKIHESETNPYVSKMAVMFSTYVATSK